MHTSLSSSKPIHPRITLLPAFSHFPTDFIVTLIECFTKLVPVVLQVLNTCLYTCLACYQLPPEDKLINKIIPVHFFLSQKTHIVEWCCKLCLCKLYNSWTKNDTEEKQRNKTRSSNTFFILNRFFFYLVDSPEDLSAIFS